MTTNEIIYTIGLLELVGIVLCIRTIKRGFK